MEEVKKSYTTKEDIIKELDTLRSEVRMLTKDDLIIAGRAALIMSGLLTTKLDHVSVILSSDKYIDLRNFGFNESLSEFAADSKRIRIGNCRMIDAEGSKISICEYKVEDYKIAHPEVAYNMLYKQMDGIDRYIESVMTYRKDIEGALRDAQWTHRGLVSAGVQFPVMCVDFIRAARPMS